MRVRSGIVLLAALAGMSGLDPAARAQTARDVEAARAQHVCRALGGDGRWHISGVVRLPVNAGNMVRRAERDFRAHVASATGGAREPWCAALSGGSYGSYVEGLEQVLRGEGRQTVRTSWTRDYLSASNLDDDSASYSQESEASRRVVAATYRQQHERERAIAERSARSQAEYRAGVAEAERRQAAHRAAMAENARQQEAYRRARADWERRVASCRAGNHADCAPATPR